jgi:hypothetical protein
LWHSIGPFAVVGTSLRCSAENCFCFSFPGEVTVEPGDGRGWRARLARLPAAQVADGGVLGEQRGEGGRPGSREPHADQRRDDLLVVDLGVALVPVLDLEALGEQAQDQVVRRRLADRVEIGLRGEGVNDVVEALAERAVAELVEARPLCGPRRARRRVTACGAPCLVGTRPRTSSPRPGREKTTARPVGRAVGESRAYSSSRMVALAWPPPSHIVCRP